MVEVDFSSEKLNSNLLIQVIFERKLFQTGLLQGLYRASKGGPFKSFILVQFWCHFWCTMSKPEKQKVEKKRTKKVGTEEAEK